MNSMRQGLCLAAALFSYGCATPPKPLYNWDEYQESVYQHLTDQDNGEQIDRLEKNLQKASGKGEKVPPGFHAHLAMLYAQQGRDDLALEHFEKEKQLFPESTTFIDFLLTQKTGAAK
ncbi:DUF4810 domain-containing protein [Aeromonas australiensis]|uniref:DUF4810 domain-containing protein n=1 Tax=Aeromonas australiensis TaxID=1114880 RepID=UPI000589FFBD|nr:DUF4810 domain-containing protein [Aeromonas australiensis]